jgi:hypothetical protein
MKKVQDSDEIAAEFKVLVKSLHELANELSKLENQITRMSLASLQNSNSVIKNFSSAFGQSGFASAASGKSNIISFPGSGVNIGCCHESEIPHTRQYLSSLSYLAAPGSSLPLGISDFRLALQRDGLILLGWDKRFTPTEERYTAYWVTSVGTPRFYASRPLLLADFPFANPDHKSYAAEDGIEFYGQKAPAYIVHVAPDLMMSNPKHKELRTAHIDMLKSMGSKVNFSYKYLLKTEKNRKPDNPPNNRAC